MKKNLVIRTYEDFLVGKVNYFSIRSKQRISRKKKLAGRRRRTLTGYFVVFSSIFDQMGGNNSCFLVWEIDLIQ